MSDNARQEFVDIRAGINTRANRLSTKVTSIPLTVRCQVCVMLNVKRNLRFDDFRMLAEKVGLDRNETDFIEQTCTNHTDEILKIWSTKSEATVGKLIELLKEDGFERMDVAKILMDWVEEDLKALDQSLSHIKSGSPREYDFALVASELGASWKMLGRALHLREYVLVEIQKNEYDLQERCFSMLLRWSHVFGSNATYQRLAEALSHPIVGRNYLAEKYCYASRERFVDHASLRDLYRMEQVKEEVNKGKMDIAKKASNKGFKVSDNAVSGNCLFRALSEQLELVKRMRVPYQELRNTLVQFLRKHPNLPDGRELFDFVDGYPSWADYLKSMGKDGTWGDRVILYAAANCYETKIRVISLLRDYPDVIIAPSYFVRSLTKPLVLGHIQELHYVSLQAQKVPAEILARGPLALEAYNEALAEGSTRVMRLPIMVIGQYRSGKTSLIKSLKGKKFNRTEAPTDGIEKDPSHFRLSNEPWNTGEKNGESASDIVFWYEDRVAQEVASLVRQKQNQESNEISPQSREPESSVQSKDVEPNTAATGGADSKQQIQKSQVFDKTKGKEDVFEVKVPNETEAKLIAEHLEKPERKHIVYSVVWDFAGQTVYYATHPIFLTPQAIYLLVHNLQLNPDAKASPVKHQGYFDETEDKNCTKTNADYLDIFMSSVSCLAKGSTATANEPDMKLLNEPEGKLPKKLPPVFLVCTHADEPYVSEDQARERSHAKLPYDQRRALSTDLARERYGSLKRNPLYGKHLFEDFFTVDNSMSGNGKECPNVDRLRKAILAVAQQLPHVKQDIPIKWLAFEKALQSKKEKGKRCISLDEAKQIASECKIDDDKHNHALNFFHDQRTVIHFDDSEELKNLVILDVEWLIDVFKKVITVKRYDPKIKDQEPLWIKLQKGILAEELLRIVWEDLREDKCSGSLIAIMAKFGLLFPWPSFGSGKEYLVPSMLMWHPEKGTTELLKTAHIPSLFLRFKQLSVDDSSDEVYVPVPLGFFSRLMLKVLQWWTEKQSKPSKPPKLFKDYANFFVYPRKGYSVILLQRFFVIEVVVLKEGGTSSERSQTSDLEVCDSVQRKVEGMLTSMKKDFCWMRNVECELAFLCPVCCEGRSFKGCDDHPDCNKEECLQFWSKMELCECDQPICEKNPFALKKSVPVESFKPWFGVSDKQEQGVCEAVLSFKESLLADIVKNVHVKDTLARQLDQPLCHGGREVPIIQYWPHLAEEFKVSEDVRIKCQHNIENSPTKHMFEFLEAQAPNFSVSDLKVGLEGISRKDLVKRLEQCYLLDAATLQNLCREHHETFDSICLQLDHYKNWKPLALNFKVPVETLQKIGTSSSYAETVLESIEKKQPDLTVKKMRDVLSVEMLRKDVCDVLDKYPELKDENSTITTLRSNLDCLEEVATLLDKESPGMKNWKHFASTFDISRNVIDGLKPRGNPSPTKALMEHIAQRDPDLTVMTFIQTLIKMKRMDVVKALKEFFCDGEDIDSLIAPWTV